MLRTPSQRRSKLVVTKPNLVPILDAVFIFIFFLLMSASFIKIYEIPSDVPIVTASEPPKNKKPFVLTLKISNTNMSLYLGSNFQLIGKYPVNSKGDYDTESLHLRLLHLKEKHKRENTIIFEPTSNVNYENIVKIMDSVREIRKTDKGIYLKDKKTGADQKLKFLFSKIVFGNIQS